MNDTEPRSIEASLTFSWKPGAVEFMRRQKAGGRETGKGAGAGGVRAGGAAAGMRSEGRGPRAGAAARRAPP